MNRPASFEPGPVDPESVKAGNRILCGACLFFLLLIVGAVIAGGYALASLIEGALPPGQRAFAQADATIVASPHAVAHGNSPRAIQAAEELSDTLQTLQPVLFRGGEDESRRLSLTGGKFLTYCELRDDRVCFLVHVPQLRRYKREVRNALIDLAWKTAQTASEDLPGGPRRLTVGLRGAFFYGGIAVGETTGLPAQRFAGPAVNTDPLLAFFAEDPLSPVPVGSTQAAVQAGGN